MTRLAYTTAEAAALIGMSREWLRKQVMAHAVPCVRLGRSVRFTPEQLAEILAANVQPVLDLPGVGPSYPPAQPPQGPTRPVSPPRGVTVLRLPTYPDPKRAVAS